jgi:hypothetical protein
MWLSQAGEGAQELDQGTVTGIQRGLLVNASGNMPFQTINPCVTFL